MSHKSIECKAPRLPRHYLTPHSHLLLATFRGQDHLSVKTLYSEASATALDVSVLAYMQETSLMQDTIECRQNGRLQYVHDVAHGSCNALLIKCI